ncbi:PLG [Mytilus coruscus]|uniref:PLG n=1 Tax=Mytilus coruscus TaxID=42192 RepID=A0A6J8DIZ3_MYTCO|nr:PLG [Mytilus coruscus]
MVYSDIVNTHPLVPTPSIEGRTLYILKLECKITALGTEYKGQINVTISGIQCKKWNSDYPHGSYYKELVGDQENYCRNPDNETGGPWCYTMDPAIRWEFCDVQYCVFTTSTTFTTAETNEKTSTTELQTTTRETSSTDLQTTSDKTSTTDLQTTTDKTSSTDLQTTTDKTSSTDLQTTSDIISITEQKTTVAFKPHQCFCPCVSKNLSEEELYAVIKELEKKLTVDKKTTSAYIRRHTSARDDRKSSVAIGAVGIVVVCIPVVLMTINDFIGFFLRK